MGWGDGLWVTARRAYYGVASGRRPSMGDVLVCQWATASYATVSASGRRPTGSKGDRDGLWATRRTASGYYYCSSMGPAAGSQWGDGLWGAVPVGRRPASVGWGDSLWVPGWPSYGCSDGLRVTAYGRRPSTCDGLVWATA